MKSNDYLLSEYPKFLTQIIKWKSDNIPEGIEFSKEVVRLLKIDNIKMWARIWNIIYLLEDTEEAKNNYLKYGISGPTKISDIGEKYLRLYGILNSIWLQMNAIVELFSIFKCTGKTQLYKQLKGLSIIKLRNIAGSHSINYLDEITNKITSFSIARITLDTNEIWCLDENNKSIKIDISKSISEYNKSIIHIYEMITSKIITSIYKNDSKQRQAFQTKQIELINVFKSDCVIPVNGTIITITGV
jgi:hypothetical protein